MTINPLREQPVVMLRVAPGDWRPARLIYTAVDNISTGYVSHEYVLIYRGKVVVCQRADVILQPLKCKWKLGELSQGDAA